MSFTLNKIMRLITLLIVINITCNPYFRPSYALTYFSTLASLLTVDPTQTKVKNKLGSASISKKTLRFKEYLWYPLYARTKIWELKNFERTQNSFLFLHSLFAVRTMTLCMKPKPSSGIYMFFFKDLPVLKNI